MKNNNKKKATPLGAFAIVSAIAAVATTVILILHNSYGFFA